MKRRSFLLTAPAAGGVGVSIAELFASMTAAQTTASTYTEANFMVYSAEEIESYIKALQAKPGSNNLYRDKNFAINLTLERNTSAKEFEWHEHRDHIIHILDGETVYELGGTPQGAHSPREGEGLAPSSEGATRVTLKKGAILIIRRGTPHKRTTPESVTFTLTGPMSPPALS
jgi:mannose-6-phosphate isomerase-like protein (cupin superfamily)